MKFTHHFICVKNRHSFSIDLDERNNSKIGVKDIRCPACSSEVELDILFSDTKSSLEGQRKINIEASQYAMKMAMDNKAISLPVKMEAVSGKKGTFNIPSKVIQSIKEKSENLIVK